MIGGSARRYPELTPSPPLPPAVLARHAFSCIAPSAYEPLPCWHRADAGPGGMSMDDTLRRWEPEILSVLRIVVALLYLQHGLSKFFGFPGSPPSSMPFFPVILGGLIETFGSLLLLVGLFTRPAAFIMSGEMAVAYWYAHFPR